MELLYIKFDSPLSSNIIKVSRTKTTVWNLISNVLSVFIPKANPDYDPLIDNVSQWLLEINAKDGIPNREIGLNENRQTIMIMPLRGNYGYWSDNNITLEYFKEHFKVVDISKNEFDSRWNAFVKENALSESYEFDKRGFSKYYRYLEEAGWDYDGYMSFTKGKYKILFDTSEWFYIEQTNGETKEFQCKNMDHFVSIIKQSTV